MFIGYATIRSKKHPSSEPSTQLALNLKRKAMSFDLKKGDLIYFDAFVMKANDIFVTLVIKDTNFSFDEIVWDFRSDGSIHSDNLLRGLYENNVVAHYRDGKRIK